MKRIVLLVTLLLHFVKQSETQGLQRCVPKPNCTECMKSPGCAWCKQMGFLKPEESNERRCDTEESLKSRHCDKEKHIINPEPKMDELKNNDLSQGPYDVIQIKPQNLKFKLRVGVPQTFQVSFKRAEKFPIDLYYLMDLSFSMRDDLDEIKHLGQRIVDTLRTFTNKIRIGFGSFVDKVALPYVSQVKSKKKNPCPSRSTTCQPAFSFKNILSLTENASDFKKEVSKQLISGNLDSPEGGFDAIMQAAVCQDVIGWHTNVTRILVYTSDDTFHIAGDGALAGILEPHDGKCHLNGNKYDGTKYDYPSIGHLSRVLLANNIKLIFAVTEEILPAYQALSKLIPQSVVGVLKKDSSNVVELIEKAYNNLSSTILLEHQGAPQGLDVAYKSHCVDSAPWRKKGECMNIKLNEQVDFTVRLNISECLGKEREFHLYLQGIGETLKVSVETLCDCDCGEREKSSPHCNNNGTLSCGVCSCDSGFMGQKCECEQQKGVASLDASCRQNNASQVCSGHGHCHCGVCTCEGSYSGTFCQCANNDCPRNYNMLCGGHGRCNCSICTCSANYTGSACECSTLTDECETKGNRPCSGHGQCECNRCHCDPYFTGKHCSEMVNTCQNYKKCIECISDHRGSGEEVMRMKCSKVHCHSAELRYIEQKELTCSTDALMYEVEPSPDGILVRYTDLPPSIDRTFVIIVSSVSGIIVIGIAVILVCRFLLELHYRREYRNFINAQKDSKWNEANNPLFQDATTTVVNPMHFDEDD